MNAQPRAGILLGNAERQHQGRGRAFPELDRKILMRALGLEGSPTDVSAASSQPVSIERAVQKHLRLFIKADLRFVYRKAGFDRAIRVQTLVAKTGFGSALRYQTTSDRFCEIHGDAATVSPHVRSDAASAIAAQAKGRQSPAKQLFHGLEVNDSFDFKTAIGSAVRSLLQHKRVHPINGLIFQRDKRSLDYGERLD